MDIKERIENVKQYFKGMQVENLEGANIIYVIVQFPPRWIIDEDIKDKFGVSIVQGQDYPGQFYFCAEMEKGFDVVFDAIEYNVEKMLTAQERASLLKQKVQELQRLFMDESISIESLRTLDFTYKTNFSKIRKKTAKTNEKNTISLDKEDLINPEENNTISLEDAKALVEDE